MFYKGKNAIRWIFNSPTLMTWGSFLTRSLSLVILLPLVLTRLDTPDISLWYIFSSIIGLQLLVDIGLSPTFSRVIAFALGGLDVDNIKDLRKIDLRKIDKNTRESKPEWKTIECICSTMWTIYSYLTIVSFFLISTLGTWALVKPVSLSNNPQSAWLAWCVILIVSSVSLIGNVYSSYLQGLNKIALLRRWEILTSFGSMLTSILVINLNGGLLGLVVVNQIWVIISILRNRYLSRFVENGRFKDFNRNIKDDLIMSAVWPSAWRSGLGNFMAYGLVQISGIVYAQFSSASGVASYLLALRLIQTINQFSQAPFYSKLPLLAVNRAAGKLNQQIDIARKGMSLAYWTYSLSFITLGLFGDSALVLINSNVSFPNSLLWSLLGLAIFAERYGAMHIHLYSTTNHIVWHTANGISGLIYVTLSFFLFNFIGVYSFPIALLISYLSFYCWYSALHSYRAFNLSFWKFEKETVFFPLVLFLLYCTIDLLLDY
jgi:hypothetical protein